MSKFTFINRSGLFTLALVLWTLLTTLVLHNSFQQEQALIHEKLQNQTFAVMQDIEQDPMWQTSYIGQQGLNRIQSWRATFGLDIHVTLVAQDGKPLLSSLLPTDTLSLNQTQNHLNGITFSQCYKALPGYPKASCYICQQPLQNNRIRLLLSIDHLSVVMHWLNTQWTLISSLMVTVFLLAALHLFVSLRYHHSKVQQNHLASQVEHQEAGFKRLLRNLPGLIYRINAQSKDVVYMSPGTLPLLGYPPEHFIDGHLAPLDVVEEDDKATLQAQIKSAHKSLKPFELVYRVRTLHGELKWVIDRGCCYLDRDNQYYVEGVILDITERELVRQQIEYLAVQDPLTELHNRYKFNDELVSAVDDAKRRDEQFAMLFIDLDRFKTINDSLGHQLGDRLLRDVAERLQKHVSDQHFLARMGGDEFVILMRNLQYTDDVHHLAKDVNQVLRRPFSIDSYELRLTCSIGIALCPNDSEESHILWRYADTAMYQVKKSGGNDYQFFTKEMSDQVQHRLRIEHSFMPALKQKQFELYYQPQIDIKSGKLKGAEALVRWVHPELGLIPPAQFIPIAEETGFIHDLGHWILTEALAQLAVWQEQRSDITLAVNISARQITDEFPHKIESLIQENRVIPNSLELEITESLLMENIDYVQPLLHDVRKKDVHFAIDDFGTGYSSLSYLRYLPINKLKIDRVFVKNLEHNHDDIAMVKAIISMGKNMGMSVLAEGIENTTQLNILEEQGCDSYQGYLFSQPLSKQEFERRFIFKQIKKSNNVTAINRS